MQEQQKEKEGNLPTYPDNFEFIDLSGAMLKITECFLRLTLFPDGIRYSKLNSRAGAQEAHGVGGAGSPWHEEVSVVTHKFGH